MTDHTQSIPSPRPPTGARPAVVLLAVLVVVLLGASVLTVVLFVGAREEHGLEVQELDRTSVSLSEAEDRLAATDTANDEVGNRISRLETQNAELRKCAVPTKDMIIAARDEDDAALRPAFTRATDNC
ncbi:hypothetical protein F4560_004634 [Saccharothrix ecbatanensis]|jgi:hypothetical protein|uniref:Uncharacterized protein n=1 Tax=Saccharothrix ecbatanensis TaxID=1105145 RepID=A0A7W9M2E3_9PSEU|nr:hypothetical protein [Saccharothrix ecbatanensis]MBB5804866.1 hypothetical protein [Saccharothrix ecbatanensis]